MRDSSKSKLPRILLHACCGPCSTHVLERLGSRFRISAIFYNPNIYPEEEYRLRRNELMRLASEMSVEVVDCSYDPENWFATIEGMEEEPEGGIRCEACFRMRLVKTASRASEMGIDVFSTTLTVGPQKDSSLIHKLGREIAGCFGVEFLDEDFKKDDGFKKSVELSRKYEIYRQNYCGCAYSRLASLARKKRTVSE
jgi:predicted adenine nucleotide alpha hydrolase (AANH) superfamily ATPase